MTQPTPPPRELTPEQAEQFVDRFVIPLLERGGFNVRTTETHDRARILNISW